ncbi:hypothetical protein GZ77_14835 [Endozoicomonas montiporae]|uniref:AlpA family transcriptional regulator n=2 Tax=Endozoicomonas montiporae TaxID=1027273 RepID=A0A081N569_9GAMM|nr:AlpA family phage regulatory protein [Endozoicomonas montiporae]AMO57528.1 hypothetical protein EZMO1_3547 [Endozoicomonas montiporae CL-33]KEQ13592.1 hypothetical protein GZ77_14835 [Endozoicomonas montiporae]
MTNTNLQTYLTRKEVLTRYGIGNTTLYRWMNDEDIQFPKSYSMGIRCARWKITELEEWEQQRKAAND